jgi:hypothetical protein
MFAQVFIKSLRFMEAGVSGCVVAQEFFRRPINALKAQFRSHASQYGILGPVFLCLLIFPINSIKQDVPQPHFIYLLMEDMQTQQPPVSSNNPFPHRGFAVASKRSHSWAQFSVREIQSIIFHPISYKQLF